MLRSIRPKRALMLAPGRATASAATRRSSVSPGVSARASGSQLEFISEARGVPGFPPHFREHRTESGLPPRGEGHALPASCAGAAPSACRTGRNPVTVLIEPTLGLD